jgi:hypothetical protein
MTGLKQVTPIRRKDGVSHEEFLQHYEGVHIPNVLQHMKPDRYAVSIFDPRDGRAPYAGMASLFWEDEAAAAAVTGRNTSPVVANDSFVERIELPLGQVRVVEHVIVPGPGSAGAPATKDEREAAFKMTFLVSPRPGESFEDIQRHWLELHAPNVASNFVDSGGVRYVVNLVQRGKTEPGLVGVAELSYRDRDAAKGHRIADDGFNAKTTGIALPGRELIRAPR